jgi:beta-lactamase regulating signal transducer with metallopeptidase domain
MNSSLLTSRLDAVLFLLPAIEALGWTLLHFVWQGTLVALAFGCFLAFSQSLSPRVRYAAGCAALSLMALAVVSTFLWELGTCAVQTAGHSAAPRIAALLPSGGANSRAAHEPIHREIITARPLFASPDSASEVHPTRTISTLAEPAVTPSMAEFVSLTTKRAPSPDRLRPWLYRLVGLWVVAVVLLSVRLAAGWRVVGRLRAQGQHKNDSVWCARFACLKQRIGVSAPVRLLWSASTTVPMVIGWARPVVLVPAALLTGLSASQLEAVLAHELAHIRRHDYLVNLLQNVLETLLFYHPAVWWVSEQVRSEREHCCDDLAAAACGGTLNYARALTALAELRHTSGSLGLAVTGGSLVNRIGRLAGMRATGPRIGGPLPILVLVVAALSAFVATSVSTRSDDAQNAVGSSSKEAAPRRIVESKPEASKTSKLTGTEVVARVNGEKILASELFERAYSTPLEPYQMSLMVAAKELEAGRLKEHEFRELQELAIRTYLNDLIKTRLLSQALLKTLDKERTRQVDSAISKMFEEYARKLEKDLRVSSRAQVDAKLQAQGQSLDHLRQEFRRRLLADEYLRKKQETLSISRDTLEAYYRNHLNQYRFPEKVRWQLLEISFERHGDRQTAWAVAQKAQAELRRGESFARVVRKYSDGPRGEQAGAFLWTMLDTPDDQEPVSPMRQIGAPGIKPVFDEPEWGNAIFAQRIASSNALDGKTPVTEASAAAWEVHSVQLQRTPSRFRRIRLHSRGGNEFNMFSRPVPNRTPPEQATILTGGVSVLIDGLDKRIGGKPVETTKLSADRIVIWSQGELADGVGREGGVVQPEDEPCDVYLEGNVVLFQRDPSDPQVMRKIKAKSATFDAREQKAQLLKAEIEAYPPSTTGTIQVWRERIRQLAPNPFYGKAVLVIRSPSGNPADRTQATDALSVQELSAAMLLAKEPAFDEVARGLQSLWQREAAEKSVRKYYDDGGTQPWTNPASLADLRLSAVLDELAPGELSAVLESADSFRIVRVVEKRPAGCKPFDEVEPSIHRKLEDQQKQQILDDLDRKATIESPYLPGN